MNKGSSDVQQADISLNKNYEMGNS